MEKLFNNLLLYIGSKVFKHLDSWIFVLWLQNNLESSTLQHHAGTKLPLRTYIATFINS